MSGESILIETRSELILMSRIKKFLTSIGPGIFIIGYVVGTGSVTTLASSGAKYGMSMTWALALSCFFTYILIVGSVRRDYAPPLPEEALRLEKSNPRRMMLFVALFAALIIVTQLLDRSGVAEAVNWNLTAFLGFFVPYLRRKLLYKLPLR